MHKYKFTVFTATYNREHLLENVYNGLKKQTFNDFEWLIVDDGSTDNTKKLVDRFVSENKMYINYIYKENGGKHTAINIGVENSNGELFFIVDSDDGVLENSLEIVNNEWDLQKDKKGLSGVVGLCVLKDGQIVGDNMPDDKKIYNFTDLYFKFNIDGDKSLVFATDVLKKYRFPEVEGVKFLPESVVWHEISKKYDMVCVNKPLRVVEYLDDGLTKNILSKNALKGRAWEFLYLINQKTYPINRYPYMWIKNYINLARYSLLSGTSRFRDIDRLFDRYMYVMLFPLGYYKYAKQRKLIDK